MAGQPWRSPSYWGPDLPLPAPTGESFLLGSGSAPPSTDGRVLLIGVRICPSQHRRESPSYWGPDLPLPAPRGESFPLGPAVPVGDRGRASDGATCWAGSSTSTNALLEGRIGGFRALQDVGHDD